MTIGQTTDTRFYTGLFHSRKNEGFVGVVPPCLPLVAEMQRIIQANFPVIRDVAKREQI